MAVKVIDYPSVPKVANNAMHLAFLHLFVRGRKWREREEKPLLSMIEKGRWNFSCSSTDPIRSTSPPLANKSESHLQISLSSSAMDSPFIIPLLTLHLDLTKKIGERLTVDFGLIDT